MIPCGRSTPSANRPPVSPLQDRHVFTLTGPRSPLVYVPAHVLDAEWRGAHGPRTGWISLPQPFEFLGALLRPAVGEDRRRVLLPPLVYSAFLGSTFVSPWIRKTFLSFAGEGPFILGAEALVDGFTKPLGLRVCDHDPWCCAFHVGPLVSIHAERHGPARKCRRQLQPGFFVEGSTSLGKLFFDPRRACSLLEMLHGAGLPSGSTAIIKHVSYDLDRVRWTLIGGVLLGTKIYNYRVVRPPNTIKKSRGRQGINLISPGKEVCYG